MTKSSLGEKENIKIEELNSDEDSGNSSANSSHEDAKKHLQFQVPYGCDSIVMLSLKDMYLIENIKLFR